MQEGTLTSRARQDGSGCNWIPMTYKGGEGRMVSTRGGKLIHLNVELTKHTIATYPQMKETITNM